MDYSGPVSKRRLLWGWELRCGIGHGNLVRLETSKAMPTWKGILETHLGCWDPTCRDSRGLQCFPGPLFCPSTVAVCNPFLLVPASPAFCLLKPWVASKSCLPPSCNQGSEGMPKQGLSARLMVEAGRGVTRGVGGRAPERQLLQGGVWAPPGPESGCGRRARFIYPHRGCWRTKEIFGRQS